MAQENSIDQEVDLGNENGKTDRYGQFPDLTVGIG